MAKVIKSVTEELQQAKVITLRTAIRPVEKDEGSQINMGKIREIENELIQKAQEKADELLKQAEETIRQKQQQLQKEEEALQEKVNAALEDASLKGYQKGFELGRNDGEQSVNEALMEARKLVDASHDEYAKKLTEAEPMVVKLAIAVAEKIIGRILIEQPEQWNHIAKTAIKEVKEHENIKLFVHPSKYEVTLSQKKELKAALNDSSDVYIYPNEELAETACIIETSFGKIDASIDSQLTEIKKHLLNIVEETEK